MSLHVLGQGLGGRGGITPKQPAGDQLPGVQVEKGLGGGQRNPEKIEGVLGPSERAGLLEEGRGAQKEGGGHPEEIPLNKVCGGRRQCRDILSHP